MTKDQEAQLQEIVHFFNQAEDLVKEIEFINGELAIPSINQLRYVGYHLVTAWAHTKNDDTFRQHLIKAENHAKRAIYDTYEAGIIYFLDSIKSFKTRHEPYSHLILEVMANYTEQLQKAENASRFILHIKRQHAGNRETYYEKIRPHYNDLQQVESALAICEPLITQKALAYRKQEQQSARRFILTTVIALLAIVVSIVITQ